MHSRLWPSPRRATLYLAGFLAACILGTMPVPAQLASRQASDGNFLVEDAEDADLRVDVLGRDWLSDFSNQTGDVLSVLELSASGLTLASGQSPVAALQGQVTGNNFGTLNGGFGVPVPAVAGASTLDAPGNIASFSELSFLSCFERTQAAGVRFYVQLECYPQNPDNSFPQIGWEFSPAEGDSFQEVRLDLRTPSYINNNPGGLSVDALLSRTRFLYLYAFDAPVGQLAQVTFRVDDLRLIASPAPSTGVAGRQADQVPVLIDDAEDLDRHADPLGRDYVTDFVFPEGDILTTAPLAGSGLTTAPFQSPLGALAVDVPSDGFGTIDAGFGVPVPGLVGASTLDAPGRLDGFRYISMLARFDSATPETAVFNVLLECYPQNSDGSYPKLLWNWSPALGRVFEAAHIPLYSPDRVLDNPGRLPVGELLARTRFLSFQFYASPVGPGEAVRGHLDDLRLGLTPFPAESRSEGWARYE